MQVGAQLVAADSEHVPLPRRGVVDPGRSGPRPSASGWLMSEVRPPLQEVTSLVGPGWYLPALGKCLRHPKMSQKAVGTYARAPAYLLGHHLGFLDNPRQQASGVCYEPSFPQGRRTRSWRASTSLH